MSNIEDQIVFLPNILVVFESEQLSCSNNPTEVIRILFYDLSLCYQLESGLKQGLPLKVLLLDLPTVMFTEHYLCQSAFPNIVISYSLCSFRQSKHLPQHPAPHG